MAKHMGLGKGLDSLIPAKQSAPAEKKPAAKAPAAKKEEPKATGAETMVKISLVSPNREQPRKNFDKEALSQLAQSIKLHGIIQPLIVVKKGKGYEIIAGERRFRAAQIAGLKELPVIVKEYTEKEIDEIALIENIQREDLNAIEEAQAYEKLINEYGLKQEDLAQRISKSRTAVANHLRLLKLTKNVQQLVIDGKLSEGHARALLAFEGAEQEKAAELIIKKGLSVRETEALAGGKTAKKSKKPAKKDVDDQIYARLEDDMKQLMGTKVLIKREGKEKGKIVVEYYSLDELDRLTELFRKGSEAK